MLTQLMYLALLPAGGVAATLAVKRLRKLALRLFYRWYFTRVTVPSHVPAVAPARAAPPALARGRAVFQRVADLVPGYRPRPWGQVGDGGGGGGNNPVGGSAARAPAPRGAVRVVALNMEMGRKFDAVLRSLVAQHPDVVVLTEVDVHTPRTGRLNQAAELAAALQMHSYAFVAEIEDPCFKHGVFEGPKGGWQGHAVLSRWPIVAAKATRLPCQRKTRAFVSHESYKWHMALSARVDASADGLGELAVHALHLDPNKTTPHGRARQYERAWRDAIEPMSRSHPHAGTAAGPTMRTIVAGDFNTLAMVHRGTGRRRSCSRRNEAAWFEEAVVRRLNGTGGDAPLLFPAAPAETSGAKAAAAAPAPRPAGGGGDGSGCRLVDPFDKLGEPTLVAGWGPMGLKVKLDWLLVDDRRWRVLARCVGDRPEEQCSDHRWVCADLRPLAAAQL